MRALRYALPPLAVAVVAGCALRTPPVAAAVTVTLPPSAPTRPADLPTTLALPALGADGRYATINRNLSPAATLWHVRAALNVAALGCRGGDAGSLVAGYNRLLRTRRAALAAADLALRAEFRARDPRAWQPRHDAYLTRLYNFFAQPLETARFCGEAAALVAQVDGVPDAALAAWAPAALDRLEAPFTDAYARYAEWRTRSAAWQAGGTIAAPMLGYAPIASLIAWAPPAPLRLASLR